jgi:WD40 repeat protein
MNAPDTSAAPVADNPFIGVQPYPEGRTLYGREQEAAELADLLISRRIVLLYSPSGAGKTSLINTALRRELALRGKGRFRASPAIRVGYLSDGVAANRYVLSALHHLERAFPANEQLPDGTLGLFTLPRYLAERWSPYVQAQEARTRRELLVFDQFEELFTLDPTDLDAKREFLAQVAEALGSRDEGDEEPANRTPLRWALFAMREDFIAELDPYKALVPTSLATRFRLNLLGREAAQRVILNTAADAGASFDEHAIDRIVSDLARVRAPRGAPGEWADGPFVEPVQLQVVCRRLWSRHMRDGKRHLRPEDLDAARHATGDAGDDTRALGAVDDALAAFYADCVREAAQDSTTRERSVRDWIEGALVSRAKLRCQVMLDPATPLPVTDAEMRALGGTLLRKDTRGGREWVELTHDRLIEPLLWDNNRWRDAHLSLLQMQAHIWNAAGRADGYLLTGDALEQAAAWAATHDHELSDVDRAFLAAAIKSRDDAHGRRRGRIFRRLGIVTTIIALLVTGASFKLAQVNRELETEKLAAEQQTVLAQRQSAMSGIRFNLSEADVLRERDPIGSVRSALVSAALLTLLERAGADATLVAPEQVTVEASLLDSLRQAPPVMVRYAGHGNAVRKALFTADGRIVSAGYDGTLRLWRVRDGRTLAFVPGEDRPLFAAALDARGTLVADGDGTERIRLWRLGAERLDPLAVIEPEQSRKLPLARITALAFLGDGVLVAATWDRRLLFFDVSHPEAPKRFATLPARVHQSVVYTLAASADGRMLATGSWDGSVAVWRNLPTPADPDARPQVERFDTDPDADRAAVNAIAFSPSGRWLAAGGHEGSVFLWETGAGMARSMRRLKGDGGHEGTVFGVAFDAAEKTLATAAIDRRVVLWRLADVLAWDPREPLPLGEPFPALPERLYGVAFDPQRAQTLALAGGPSVFVVDIARPASPLATKLDGAEVASNAWRDQWQAIALSADARVVAASRRDRVAFWSPDARGAYVGSAGERGRADIVHSGLTRVAMDGAGVTVLTGARDGEVRMWRPGKAEPRTLLPAKGAAVIALTASADGRLAAASAGEQLTVWRIDAGGEARQIAREDLGARRVRALAFDRAGERLAAGSFDGVVRVFRVLPDGVQPESMTRSAVPSEINVLAFAPDGSHLATGAEDSTIVFWKLPLLEPVREYTEHRSGVVSLAFCAQGAETRLYSSDRDGEVIARLSMIDQRHRRPLMEGFRKQRYLAVTPGCERVATSGATPLVWNVEPGFIRRQACVLADSGEEALSACEPVRQEKVR